MYKTDFEISSETGRVRCRVCVALDGSEPWILRSSALGHLKSDRHRENEVAKKGYDETHERLRQSFHRDAERSAAMWDEFLTPEAIPSIQVNAREAVGPALPVSIEECDEAEWLRDFINGAEDTSCSGTDSRDRSLDEWLAASFGEAIQLGQDEEDETVTTNVLNAACSSFIEQKPLRQCRLPASRFSDAFGRVRECCVWETIPR